MAKNCVHNNWFQGLVSAFLLLVWSTPSAAQNFTTINQHLTPQKDEVYLQEVPAKIITEKPVTAIAF